MTKTKIKEIEKNIKTIEKFRENEPEGNICVVNTKYGVRYRLKTHNGDGSYSVEYLKKQDRRIKALAKKRYYRDLYPVLKEELASLRNQEKHYHPERKYEVYEELGALKQYVEPLLHSDSQLRRMMIDQRIESWVAEGFTSSFYEESKKIITDDGTYVRSKSEAFIYNELLKNSHLLKFKYENELYLEAGCYTVRPDFEIISIDTGEVYYWEHVGMFGDINYSNAFVSKINNYILSGIYPRRTPYLDL